MVGAWLGELIASFGGRSDFVVIYWTFRLQFVTTFFFFFFWRNFTVFPTKKLGFFLEFLFWGV